MTITRRQFSKSLFIGSAAWALANHAWANTPDRIALVIGNSAYKDDPLPNAKNDARDMAAALRELKFDVVEAQDATRAQMQAALAEVGKRLGGKNATALFYFAGHGLQLDWRNYLMPVDAVLNSASDVAKSCVDVEEALGTFVRAKTKLNVVVLDACRNNPFTEKATGKGLAQMDAPPSTLLAYATAPGNVAEDGKGSNGLYTSALLPEIKKPEQRIEDVFKRTRFMVRRQSLGRQIPWESTSLEDDFYFLPPESSVKASEEQLKREIEAELAAWNHVKDAKEPDAFIEYLRTYPSGRYTELAQFRLDQISKPVVVASAPKGINQKVAPGQLRYLTGEFAKWELVNHVRGTKQAFPLKISRHDDHIAVASLGVFGEYVTSQMGAVVSFPGIRYEPGLMLAPADIGIGKTWKSAHKKIGTGNWRGQEDLRLDFRAFAREVITIPAGTFPVYKVQGRGWVSGIATDSGRHYGQSAEFNCLIHAERLVPVQYEELRLGSGYQYKFHQTLTMMEWRPVPST